MIDHVNSGLRSLAPIAAALCVAVTGCASVVNSDAPTLVVVPTAGATAVPSGTSAPSVGATGVDVPQLLVLGDGTNEEAGMWIYADDGGWTRGAKTPGVTAIARDGEILTLASQGSLEFREVPKPQERGSSQGMKLGAQVPLGTVVSVDCLEPGRAVVGIVDANGLEFAVVDADGTGRVLTPAPDSPFGPSIAWLDAHRLVALSTDNRQVSRLAVIDTAKGTLSLLHGLVGVRAFAVSPDRLWLAAAIESGVYVAPVSDWLADRGPATAATLKPSQVVWDLALSGDGSRLAMFSGTEAADGTVGDIHEVGYGRKPGGWARIFDSPVPFSQAIGQVWLV